MSNESDNELNNKAQIYLIRENYLISCLLQKDQLKEVLLNIYKDAYKQGVEDEHKANDPRKMNEEKIEEDVEEGQTLIDISTITASKL